RNLCGWHPENLLKEKRILLMKIELDALAPEPKRKLTDDEYDFIYGKEHMGRSPRACIDLIVVSGDSVLLAGRNIEPFKGSWALPGGGIMFGESINETIDRSAKVELGVTVVSKKFIGNIEHYPDGPNKHSISIAYAVTVDGAP